MPRLLKLINGSSEELIEELDPLYKEFCFLKNQSDEAIKSSDVSEVILRQRRRELTLAKTRIVEQIEVNLRSVLNRYANLCNTTPSGEEITDLSEVDLPPNVEAGEIDSEEFPESFQALPENYRLLVYELRQLLAIIHRDGGHYTAEYGLLNSIKCAQDLVPQYLSAVSDADNSTETPE